MDVVLPRRVSELFKPSFIKSYDENLYHSQFHCVSASMLKEVRKSPRHFLNKTTMDQIGIGFKESEAMRFGRLCHKSILEAEDFKKNVVIMPVFGDLRSKANKEAKEEWSSSIASTAIVITKEESNKIFMVTKAILEHEDITGLLGHPDTIFEITLFSSHDKTKLGTRSRIDIINPTLGVIADLKTSNDVDLDSFSRSIWKYKYHLQMAYYQQMAKEVFNREFEVKLIAVESSSPHSVAIYKLDDGFLDYGLSEAESAMNYLAKCVDENIFPGPQVNKCETISIPNWVMNKAIDF